MARLEMSKVDTDYERNDLRNLPFYPERSGG